MTKTRKPCRTDGCPRRALHTGRCKRHFHEMWSAGELRCDDNGNPLLPCVNCARRPALVRGLCSACVRAGVPPALPPVTYATCRQCGGNVRLDHRQEYLCGQCRSRKPRQPTRQNDLNRFDWVRARRAWNGLVTSDLTPAEKAVLAARARRYGVTPTEFQIRTGIDVGSYYYWAARVDKYTVSDLDLSLAFL